MEVDNKEKKPRKNLEEKRTEKGSETLGVKFSYILSLVNLGKHWSLFYNRGDIWGNSGE